MQRGLVQIADAGGSKQHTLGPHTGAAGAPSRRVFSLFGSKRTRQAELISSLNDVAAAVSSTVSVEDVLRTIVDRAKRVTNTEKAVLMLTEDDSEKLDLETLVVRGKREQHPQDWWEAQIVETAPIAFANGLTMLDSDEANDAWIVYSPIKVQARAIGLLVAINSFDHRFTHEQLDFLAILSAFAATAIENARLAEETRYVLLASERDRIAREMHDGISQSLFSISLGLELAKKQVKKDPAAVSERLGDLQEHLSTAMTELRRFIYDLRPVKLQELGLAGAIDFWIREITVGRPVTGELEVIGEVYHIGPNKEACLYRVAKEAVSNIVRHADARRFTVRMEYGAEIVALYIEDDGHGFIVDDAIDGRTEGSGMGLRSIRERVRRESGTVNVDSSPGDGTRITVTLPAGESS